MITLVLGPVGASKTTHAINEIIEGLRNHRSSLLITVFPEGTSPSYTDRTQIGLYASSGCSDPTLVPSVPHNALVCERWCNDLTSLFHAIHCAEDDRGKMFDHIYIDEFQFIQDLCVVERLSDFYMVRNQYQNITLISLNGDKYQEPMGFVHHFLVHNPRVLTLFAVCTKCADGAPAPYSICLEPDSNDDIIAVGGQNTYTARCKKCVLNID